jgi:uncharacterized membrane protein
VNKTRAEAFSDGVLAVAITLLALDLHVSASAGHASLGRQLREQWPSFAAYVVSFFVIGVIWINHHALFALAARVDRVLLAQNLFLLMWVTSIPFTTSTLAEFLRSGGADARWAVLIYGASMEGMAISFTLLLHRLIAQDLLITPVSQPVGRQAVRRFGIGALIYPVAIALGLWSAPLMLLVMAVVTGYYMFEQSQIVRSESD